ncbi:DUF6404 family protein [Vibrio diabolicus]|uniref:DUF6404 family protein n=1 Tax=Vibrio diabolicus TaxID=50719 RepID=UPI00211AEE42|nr:DUF6404 family protein [Vibrio diabolicus]MCG6235930.1 DUF6404 family protein [Vibrio diabolicus]
MENIAFIQQDLIEKGVPKDLTKLNANLWSKLIFSETKPLVLQSPVQVFFKQGIVFGLIWGLFMWLFLWRVEPGNWLIQLVSTICFGCIMGGVLSIVSLKRIKNWVTRVGKIGVVLTISPRLSIKFEVRHFLQMRMNILRWCPIPKSFAWARI